MVPLFLLCDMSFELLFNMCHSLWLWFQCMVFELLFNMCHSLWLWFQCMVFARSVMAKFSHFSDVVVTN